MSGLGWNTILEGWPWFTGAGHYPISAYSEFMPPPLLGRSPYGSADPLFPEGRSVGVAGHRIRGRLRVVSGPCDDRAVFARKMMHLTNGRPAHGIATADIADNPYWPEELAEHAGNLDHERFVLLISLALARTQDDKGRVRWTLFGSSEQGPERAFWNSFLTAPRRELPAEQSWTFYGDCWRPRLMCPKLRSTTFRHWGFGSCRRRTIRAFPTGA